MALLTFAVNFASAPNLHLNVTLFFLSVQLSRAKTHKTSNVKKKDDLPLQTLPYKRYLYIFFIFFAK